MDHPGVTREGEYHGLVPSEELVEIPVFQPVWMFRLRLECHQVNDVDDADTDVRHVLPQQRHSCERLERRHVAGAGHNHVGIACIIACPRPDTYPRSTVAGGRFDIEPLPVQLLARDDQVDVVPASKAVIRHRKEAVRIRRQVDPNDIGAFVRDMIDEAGILVGKPVVVLPPDQRGQ